MNFRILLCLLILGCSSNTKKQGPTSLRTPAESINQSPAYTFTNHPNCFAEEKLSALTGYPVGPGSSIITGGDPRRALLRPFYSDGCSSSPNGIPIENPERWTHCCVHHDVKYWLGGTQQEKLEADAALESCIAETGHPTIAKIYKAFVEKFGGPSSRQTYRWGYGWNFQRPYSPLRTSERKQIYQLYEKPQADLEKSLSETKSLVRLCGNFDPLFYGISEDEISVFQALNSRLVKNDTIEWAYWGYFNLGHRDFVVKLKNCKNPIQIVFGVKSKRIDRINSDCPNIQ